MAADAGVVGGWLAPGARALGGNIALPEFFLTLGFA